MMKKQVLRNQSIIAGFRQSTSAYDETANLETNRRAVEQAFRSNRGSSEKG